MKTFPRLFVLLVEELVEVHLATTAPVGDESCVHCGSAVQVRVVRVVKVTTVLEVWLLAVSYSLRSM